MTESEPFYRGCGKLVVGWGLAPTVLHHTTVFTAKLSGIFAMVRRFIAYVRQTSGRVGACPHRLIIAMPCYITMPCYTAELSGIFTMVRRFIAGVVNLG